MKKVLMIAPFTILPGENGFNRFSYLAEKLSQRGHDVTLITSRFRHGDKINRAEIAESLPYQLVLIDEPGYNKNMGIKRIVSHTIFEVNLYRYLATNKLKYDVLYAAYPLIGAAYIAGINAKKMKKPFIIDVQDVWPEAVKVAIRLPEFIVDFAILPFTMYANRIYKLADHVIAVSDTYLNRVKSVHPHASSYLSVYIGTDLGYFDKCSETSSLAKAAGEFWVIYIGTLSYSYDIKTVIKAVALLNSRGHKNIRFKVLGTGPMLKSLKLYAVQENSPTDFLGMQSYQRMVQYLKNSDVAVNAIVARSYGSITNKIGDFLAAGLPILNSCLNEEFYTLVNEYNLGINYSPGDYERLAQLILFEMANPASRKEQGSRSRQIAQQFFDRQESYQPIYELIEKAE